MTPLIVSNWMVKRTKESTSEITVAVFGAFRPRKRVRDDGLEMGRICSFYDSRAFVTCFFDFFKSQKTVLSCYDSEMLGKDNNPDLVLNSLLCRLMRFCLTVTIDANRKNISDPKK